jgi:protein arginine kinase activator
MKCEICGSRKAVIHIQQVIGKERIDLHLCDSCALERGISSNEERIELSISSLLHGLVDLRKVKGAKEKICSRCGSTWEQIGKRQQMGCPECYTVFAKEAQSFFQQMVEKPQHRGKLPKRLRTYKTYLVDVVKLKEGLKEALRREDYERAARIRDRIKDLENIPGEE